MQKKYVRVMFDIYMSDICLLPGERWDDLSIFKGQSNISVSPTLQLNNQPSNHPDFFNNLLDWREWGNLEFGHNNQTRQPVNLTEICSNAVICSRNTYLYII